MKGYIYRRPKLTGDPLLDEARLENALWQLETATRLHAMPSSKLVSELRKLMQLWDEYDDVLEKVRTTPDTKLAILMANRCRSSESSAFHMALGEALGKGGRKKEACAAFDRARALDPQWPTVMEHYAEYLASIGDFIKCAEVINTEPVANILNKGDTTANLILSLIAKHPDLRRRVKPALIRFCRWLSLPAIERQGSSREFVIHLSDELALPTEAFRGIRRPKCTLRQCFRRTSMGMQPSGISGL